tara:strand:- start:1967 stop:3901 length:1935 start_codon:yes stop_codon:yes gene_type:complete
MKTNKNKIIKNKTRKISLKNDFYSFINKDWLRKKYIKDNDIKIDLYSILEDKVERDIYKNIILKNKDKDIMILKNSLMKYHNKNIEKSVIKKLEALKLYAKDENNFYSFVKYCIEENIDLPFNWDIQIDKKNTDNYITLIDEEYLTLDNKDFYLKKSEYFTKIRNDYIKYIEELLNNSLTPLNEYYNVKNIMSIEKNIAKLKLDIELTRYTSSTFNKLNNNDLKKIGFDLNKFTNIMNYNYDVKEVNVPNVKYLKNIMKQLQNWNQEPWISYWKYNIIKSVMNYHRDWNKIHFNFFNKKIQGQKKDISLKKVFINKVNIYFNTYISKKYIREYNFTKVKDLTLDLFNRIIKVYYKRIEKNEWIEEATKNKILTKLKSIRLTIGTKKRYIKDGKFKFIGDDPVHNRKEYNKWKIETKIKMLKNKQDKEAWRRFIDINTFDVNAYYIPVSNEIIIPYAILQKPFVDINKPLHYNMGYFGTTIAHEITHAFNDDGMEHDENGIFTESFWSKNDEKEFEKKSEKIKDMYEKYSKKKQISINKEYSFGENFADIMGLLVSEEVILDNCFYLNILGNDKDKLLKEFYKYYVEQWKSKSTKKYKLYKKLTDEHTISLIRCNCSLMMSENFMRIYNIKKGDLMYNSNFDSIF